MVQYQIFQVTAKDSNHYGKLGIPLKITSKMVTLKSIEPITKEEFNQKIKPKYGGIWVSGRSEYRIFKVKKSSIKEISWKNITSLQRKNFLTALNQIEKNNPNYIPIPQYIVLELMKCKNIKNITKINT